MIMAEAFIEPLRALEYTQFVGVPCSFLKPFINYVIGDRNLAYVGAASEGEAVGIAMGAYLTGCKTVVMCQNSGFGNMVNPLTSLNYPFRVPALLIVTWRGEPGIKDEPQHEQMGRIMPRLLEALEIPWQRFPQEEERIGPALEEAEACMQQTGRPYALIMSEGAVAKHALEEPPNPRPERTEQRGEFVSSASERMSRTELIELLREMELPNEAVVATTGKTGRELFTLGDRANYLYVVGGMGTASGIGFGIAHAQKRQKVMVMDGDGAALMKLGAMATIGYYQPPHFLHIVLDNESHDSTGGQRTSAVITRFADVAAACHYRATAMADRPEAIREAVQWLRSFEGPTLLHVKIRAGSPKELGRPTVKPHEVKDRFMEFLRTNRPAGGRNTDDDRRI